MKEHAEPRVTGQPEAGNRERPGCITIYAILLALGGIANIVVSALVFGQGFIVESDFATVAIILMLCMFAWSFIPFVMAVGLWRMRMWAWWLVVIFQVFGLLVACFALALVVPAFATGLEGQVGTAELIILFAVVPLGLLINVVILYWFLRNRDRFRRPGVVHVGGRALEEPASENVAVIVAVTVVGVLVILCVVGAAIIAILTLLGPQIGNTFSEITRELMTPVP